jgi:hypothetical protein
MEGGQMRLVRKQLQHLDLRLGRNEWSKFHKQKTKKAKLFSLFWGMLLRFSVSQKPANSTFKTGKTGLFITLANSQKLEVLEDFSPFSSSIFLINEVQRTICGTHKNCGNI